jgi:hypothetical protein
MKANNGLHAEPRVARLLKRMFFAAAQLPLSLFRKRITVPCVDK